MDGNVNREALRIAPLLPPASSIPLYSLILPPLVLFLTLCAYDLYQLSRRTLDGHVIRTRTHHARFLPAEAAHAFNYPGLYLGVDLGSLEAGKLDLGRLFRWQHPHRWSLLGMRSSGYLHAPKKGEEPGIQARLLNELERHGVRAEAIDRIYTVSMPSYIGFEGINPLVVHFGYERDGEEEMRLAVVVLEVHNTFAERHLYVLRVGENEDAAPRGFDHQWTFPRSFHVSPFNDRSGSYRVTISDPLPHTSSSFPSTSLININILLLTDDSSPQKKLLATLHGRGERLTPFSLLYSLVRFPLSLFLTTPRILYEATRLHYKRKLDVYPRPELHSGAQEDGVLNPVAAMVEPGSVLWQTATDADRYARSVVESYLMERCEALKVRVKLQPEDRAVEAAMFGTAGEELTITYASALFFSDLLLAPSASLALAMADDRWRVSDIELFTRFLAADSKEDLNRAARAARRLRRHYIKWLASFALGVEVDTPERHPLDGFATWALVRHLIGRLIAEKLGYYVFRLTRARFVEGTEPWTVLARRAGDDRVRVADTIRKRAGGIGSIIRPS